MKTLLLTSFRAFKARIGILLLLALTMGSVIATDNYVYKDNEYAIISGGRSPDHHWSIAAHGEGPYGEDQFDLYLMREPAHQKRGALEISDCLDTGPISIVALWAPDSAHVAILNRSDRHVLDIRLYGVIGGKVQPIEVSPLVNSVGNSHLKPDLHYENVGGLYRLTWEKADRFTLEEWDSFDAAEPIFGKGMEDYLSLDRLGPQRTFTHFSAQAVCKITEKGELRTSRIKPLPPEKWPKTIIYSPHLLYDHHSGLHNTETTSSSLEAQKEQEKGK